MARYLGSWRVVDPRHPVPDGLTSVEESIYISNAADVAGAVSAVASALRRRLRSDAEYRKSLGIETLSPDLLNIVFQPPLTNIEA